MSEPTVGVIGCGKQARKHLRGLHAAGARTRLADVDANRARALAEEFDTDWVASPAELLSAADVRAIDVCTPTRSHGELILAALDAGKDFFCEKPLVVDMGEALAIEERARSRGAIGMVGFVYRFAPVFERLHELIAPAGPLGGVVRAHMRIGGRGSHQVWKHSTAEGGGVVNEMLVHMLDLAVWFFGPLQGVTVHERGLLRARRRFAGREVCVDADDYIVLTLRTERGVPVLCQADFVTPAFAQYIEVQGENGTAVASIQAEMPSYYFLAEPRPGFEAGRFVPIDRGDPDFVSRQMKTFVSALRSRVLPDRCTVADSIHLMQALEMIETAGRG